ncbi:hypothetical protein [Halobellus sp. EA9]|uniref:hypothetical protein n=1 Tax=Halobellus sp. EA9 TaxID=3421647 RepID=UPI003EBE8594
MSAVLNTLVLLAVVVLGFGVGFILIERRANDPPAARKQQRPGPEDVQVSLNTAILYATIALVLSGVVTEWPPEGQTTLPILEDVVFFGTAFVAAIIVGRVTRLIYKVESKYGG